MFPTQLDGARVLYRTSPSDFGTVDGTPILYLAICAYDESACYLFLCDKDFNVIQDHCFDSILQCKQVANTKKDGIVWIE